MQESGHRAEAAWKQFLEAWLPPQYEIGTRKYIVADTASGGAKSRETDLVVFHPSYPRMLRENTTVLASGVVAAFSVKLTLDSAGLSEAVESAQELRRLLPGPPASTVRDQLLSPIMFGVLAHSHCWHGANSAPISNIENRLRDQRVRNPREQLDVVCVTDLGSWFRACHVVTKEMAEQFRLMGLYDRPHVQDIMFREREVTSSGQVLGGLIYALLRRLAAFDPTIRPIAEGMKRVGTGEREGNVRTVWPLVTVLDRATLEQSLDTRTAVTRSPTPGPWPTTPNGRHRGEPAAWKHARRVRRAAWEYEPMPTSETAPQADSTSSAGAAECLVALNHLGDHLAKARGARMLATSCSIWLAARRPSMSASYAAG